MRKIFLGKPWHWALIVVVSVVFWWAGGAKAHVIHFNQFVSAIMLGVVAVIVLLIRTTKPGDVVTRDELVDVDNEEETG